MKFPFPQPVLRQKSIFQPFHCLRKVTGLATRRSQLHSSKCGNKLTVSAASNLSGSSTMEWHAHPSLLTSKVPATRFEKTFPRPRSPHSLGPTTTAVRPVPRALLSFMQCLVATECSPSGLAYLSPTKTHSWYSYARVLRITDSTPGVDAYFQNAAATRENANR